MESNIIIRSIEVLEDLAFDMSRDMVYEAKYGSNKPILNTMSLNARDQEYSYSEIEDLILESCSNPESYTERTFRYYYQTNIIPKPIKPARNRSYFNSLHLISYLFVEEFKEFYELDKVSTIIDELEIISKVINPLKIYDYYQYLTKSKTYYMEFAEMLAVNSGMDISKSYEEMKEVPKDCKLSKSQYNKMNLVLGIFRMERKAGFKKYSELRLSLPEDKQIKEAFDSLILTMELILGAKKKLAILEKIKEKK